MAFISDLVIYWIDKNESILLMLKYLCYILHITILYY